MTKWLGPALDYTPRWLDYQRAHLDQPGYVLAVVRKGDLILERAGGTADLATGEKLNPRHRFRVASHSKTFTAAGIMGLREAGKLGLDDRVGLHVRGLHSSVADSTIGQLLSHSAGIVRDGLDSDHWSDRRPFPAADELRAGLGTRQPIAANSRFKYSNFGFGLLGLVVEAVTGEAYPTWMTRNVIGPAGLKATAPDFDPASKGPTARGHSGKLPLGHRITIAGRNPTNALAAATGFVSTAGDLASFFSQLDPRAEKSFLSVASRREMTRPQWRNPHSALERYYGLGTMIGSDHGWPWFGHGGAFQGFITRTAVLTEHGISVSLLTNAIDGQANPWLDGIIHIMRKFAAHGAPKRSIAGWAGRWWSLWAASDLVPMGRRVLVANPALAMPFTDATELEVSGRDRGTIALANGYGSYGERVRRTRAKNGAIAEIMLGGSRLLPEVKIASELRRREAAGKD